MVSAIRRLVASIVSTLSMFCAIRCMGEPPPPAFSSWISVRVQAMSEASKERPVCQTGSVRELMTQVTSSGVSQPVARTGWIA